ncbi:hypothetical protein BDR22DRAFT_432565 [Usnea florida]
MPFLLKSCHFSTDESRSWFIFYSGFFPLVGFIHVIIDTICFFLAYLNPIYTLTLSILLLTGWIIQVCFWCHCDYAPDPKTCYQFYVAAETNSNMMGSLAGVSGGLTAAKVILGMVVVAMYVTYSTLATVALQNKRRGDHVRIVDDEEGEIEEIEEQQIEESEDRYSAEYDAIVSHSLERPNSSTSFLRIGIAV